MFKSIISIFILEFQFPFASVQMKDCLESIKLHVCVCMGLITCQFRTQTLTHMSRVELQSGFPLNEDNRVKQ